MKVPSQKLSHQPQKILLLQLSLPTSLSAQGVELLFRSSSFSLEGYHCPQQSAKNRFINIRKIIYKHFTVKTYFLLENLRPFLENILLSLLLNMYKTVKHFFLAK